MKFMSLGNCGIRKSRLATNCHVRKDRAYHSSLRSFVWENLIVQCNTAFWIWWWWFAFHLLYRCTGRHHQKIRRKLNFWSRGLFLALIEWFLNWVFAIIIVFLFFNFCLLREIKFIYDITFSYFRSACYNIIIQIYYSLSSNIFWHNWKDQLILNFLEDL